LHGGPPTLWNCQEPFGVQREGKYVARLTAKKEKKEKKGVFVSKIEGEDFFG
jgi:hypothetical protein